METRTDEIANGIYRFSTYIERAGLAFNQYLVLADQPLLFHCGLRNLYPLISQALSTILPVDRLRWISFGHVEADELGGMNEWLAAAPNAQVAFGAIGCTVSVNDLASRPPLPLQNQDRLDLGGKTIRYLYTPHVPHGWDAGILFEETTSTLLCGDLFTRMSEVPPRTSEDIVGPAFEAEDTYLATALTPQTGPTIRRLMELAPATLALMHGSAFDGDCRKALGDLASGYEKRLADQLSAPHSQ